ncbi:MAG: tetratricopeptide repeat-containing sensor histidine kinase [Bacteroidota bacterium]
MRLKIFLLFTASMSYIYPQASADSILSKVSSLDDSTKTRILLEETWNRRSNDPLTAIQLGKAALTITKATGDKVLEAKANNYLGVTYTNIGALEIALEYHYSALNAAKESNDRTQIGYSHNNIGVIYRIRNNIEAATEHIQDAIKIFESINEEEGAAYCYINIGRLYAAQDDFNNALVYFERTNVLAVKVNNKELLARVLLEIAKLSQRKGDFSRAERSYLELENLYKKINYLKGFAEVWSGLSDIESSKGNMSAALKYSFKALELSQKIINPEGEVNNLNDIALIYLALNNSKASEKYLYTALKRSNEINEPGLTASTYHTFYKLYKQIGNTDSALFYFEKYHNLKDSIVTKEEILKLGELESLVKIERTEREKEILQNDLENQIKQRNYLIIIVLLFVILVIIVTFRYFEKQRISEKLNQVNIVKDKFFRIIAHDLREPFHAIFTAIGLLRDQYDELSDDDRKETIRTIGDSIKRDFDLLENLLMWAKNQRQEIKFEPRALNLKTIIQKIVDLIQTNLTNKDISLIINCPDELLVYADEQMLNTILRNTIFNSVKFSHVGGEINISATTTGNKIDIIIKDNGLGMDRETLENMFVLDKKTVSKGTAGETGSGLGMILTKEFIEAHKGTIGVESRLGQGTTITLTLPANL